MHEIHNFAYQMFISYLHSNLICGCKIAFPLPFPVFRTTKVGKRPELEVGETSLPYVQSHCILTAARDATTFSKLGIQFLGLWYYYPSTEKIRQVYPVWCSRYIITLCFSKNYVNSWGSVQILGRSRPPTPSGCAHDRCVWQRLRAELVVCTD